MDVEEIRKKGKKYEGQGDIEIYQVGDRICAIMPDGDVLEAYWSEEE